MYSLLLEGSAFILFYPSTCGGKENNTPCQSSSLLTHSLGLTLLSKTLTWVVFQLL